MTKIDDDSKLFSKKEIIINNLKIKPYKM